MILRRTILLTGLMAGVITLAISALVPVPSFAGDWVQKPVLPKGKGDKCVADTDFMRRNHMNMLLHQRDDTMHEGIRTKRFSLNECISCHVVKGADNKPVTVEDPKHFCRQCHDYTAVRVDCFECHASRPDSRGKKAQMFQGGPSRHARNLARDADALARYLRSAKQ